MTRKILNDYLLELISINTKLSNLDDIKFDTEKINCVIGGYYANVSNKLATSILSKNKKDLIKRQNDIFRLLLKSGYYVQ